jgi:hypothetical protein
VPILVDAAAEELVVPNPHLAQGADLSFTAAVNACAVRSVRVC